MARKIKCKRGEKRFTVIQVNGDPYDTHAGRSFERALELAMPDRGSMLTVRTVCAPDGASARLPSTYRKRGRIVRRMRYKRGG